MSPEIDDRLHPRTTKCLIIQNLWEMQAQLHLDMVFYLRHGRKNIVSGGEVGLGQQKEILRVHSIAMMHWRMCWICQFLKLSSSIISSRDNCIWRFWTKDRYNKIKYKFKHMAPWSIIDFLITRNKKLSSSSKNRFNPNIVL